MTDKEFVERGDFIKSGVPPADDFVEKRTKEIKQTTSELKKVSIGALLRKEV